MHITLRATPESTSPMMLPSTQVYTDKSATDGWHYIKLELQYSELLENSPVSASVTLLYIITVDGTHILDAPSSRLAKDMYRNHCWLVQTLGLQTGHLLWARTIMIRGAGPRPLPRAWKLYGITLCRAFLLRLERLCYGNWHLNWYYLSGHCLCPLWLDVLIGMNFKIL